MKVWQGCLIAFGAFVLLIGTLVGVVFYATGGIVDTADEFFEAAGEGDYPRAYSLTSQQLQRGTSEEQLTSFILDYGLNEVTDTSWSSRNINNNDGELVGTLTTANGGEIPIEIDLIYEGDEWKIRFIDVGAAGLQSSDGGGGGRSEAAPVPLTLPTPEEQDDLVYVAGNGFVNAIRSKDYAAWEDRLDGTISAEALQENFSNFEPRERDVRILLLQDPDFEHATALDENGHLVLDGTYRWQSSELRFEYIWAGDAEGDPQLIEIGIELN